jgi:hypothetical protein
MKMKDQKIKQILKQETEIPEIVERQAFDTLDRITAGKENHSINKKNSVYGRMHHLKIAAAVLVVVAGISTSAYAAGKYFGLFDFFSELGMTEKVEMEKITDKKVDGTVFSNDYVTYTVREAICDNHLIYMVIEGQAKDNDKYLLIPEDCSEEDSVTFLRMEDVAEGTVGEYAASLGKEVLNTSIRLSSADGICAVDNKMAADGTVSYCITVANDNTTGEIELDCVGTARTKEMTTASRAEEKITVVNNGTDTETSYKLKGDDLEKETGIVMDHLTISETELGIYADFQFHASNEAAKTLIEQCMMKLTDRDGNEFSLMPYYAGGGLEFDSDNEEYSMTAAYQKIDPEQELYVMICDYEENVEYGPYEITIE